MPIRSRKKVYEHVASFLSRRDPHAALEFVKGLRPSSASDLDIASLEASIREFQGRTRNAASILMAAVSRHPRDPRPHIELVELYVDNGRLRSARRRLTQLWRSLGEGRLTGSHEALSERFAELETSLAEAGGFSADSLRFCAAAIAGNPTSESLRSSMSTLLQMPSLPGAAATRERRRRAVTGRTRTRARRGSQ